MTKKVIKRKTTTVLCRNGNTMTESQYFSKIRSILRSGFRYWKPMQLALEKASRPSQSLNKRIKKEYKCEHCSNWFKRADCEIDHKIECGSLQKYEDIVPFIQRLTQEELSSYAILCKPCHRIKTNNYKELKKMKNKHGINSEEIHFNPLCDNVINKYDIIGNDTLKRRLYCKEKGVFIIVTDDPINDYITDEDLKLNFKIIDNGRDANF